MSSLFLTRAVRLFPFKKRAFFGGKILVAVSARRQPPQGKNRVKYWEEFARLVFKEEQQIKH